MAHQTNSNPASLSRRGILQAGALAIGAALLPASAGAAVAPGLETPDLAVFRADYRRKVEALAEKLRPRFESGELHNYNDADSEAEERLGHTKYEPPIFALENELEAGIPDFPAAYLILACSPNEDTLDGGIHVCEARFLAAQCLARDVLYVARSRGWYVETPGEELPGDALRGPIPL